VLRDYVMPGFQDLERRTQIPAKRSCMSGRKAALRQRISRTSSLHYKSRGRPLNSRRGSSVAEGP
jgi:hypothetical protein